MKALIKIFSAILLLSICSCANKDRYIAFSGYAQGGPYTVKANLKGVKVQPQTIRDSVECILQRIDFSVSGYNRKSILSALNSGERVTPDEVLKAAYDTSYAYFVRTGGAFDVAAGPLFNIWGFGFSEGRMPTDGEVASILASSGMKHLSPTMEAVLAKDGTLSASDLVTDGSGVFPVLNFNAIAQGFTCDLVADYLHSIGVKDMLVDIGEIYCEGLNPSGKGWTVGIDRPVDGNMTPGADLEGVWTSDGGPCGIVTSGNYRKFYIRDGKKYAHTVDPRTGYPVQHNLLSATIVAPTAAEADAIATFCMVIGEEQSKAFIEADPRLEGFLITSDGEWASAGFTLRK